MSIIHHFGHDPSFLILGISGGLHSSATDTTNHLLPWWGTAMQIVYLSKHYLHHPTVFFVGGTQHARVVEVHGK